MPTLPSIYGTFDNENVVGTSFKGGDIIRFEFKSGNPAYEN